MPVLLLEFDPATLAPAAKNVAREVMEMTKKAQGGDNKGQAKGDKKERTKANQDRRKVRAVDEHHEKDERLLA